VATRDSGFVIAGVVHAGIRNRERQDRCYPKKRQAARYCATLTSSKLGHFAASN
jgi:hypothetical protein